MCNKAVGVCPWQLGCIPDRFKTQAMRNEVTRGGPWNLRYVPDWFVKQQQIDVWYDKAYYCNDNRLIK